MEKCYARAGNDTRNWLTKNVLNVPWERAIASSLYDVFTHDSRECDTRVRLRNAFQGRISQESEFERLREPPVFRANGTSYRETNTRRR